MAAIEVGRVCYKTTGRKAAKKVVIAGIGKGNIVEVVGNGIKRQKCNIRHLFPTEKKIEVLGKEKDEDILRKLKG